MTLKRKQVKYLAEVVSYGIKEENLSEHKRTAFPIGKQFPVTRIDWRKDIGFWAYDPNDSIRLRFYCLLTGCAHLEGGFWKLIPYEEEI